jgi:predicted dehydrogenase
MDDLKRRSFLLSASSAGLVSALPDAAFAGRVSHEVAAPGLDPDAKPEHSIKFAVIGLDHNHIFGITSTVQRGGGQLVSLYATDPAQIAAFRQRFGPVKLAASEDEILNDPSIQLVCAAPIPDQRAALGIRVMRHGKDFLVDKPAVISLEELAQVRQTIQETQRIFAILYSERLEVKAAVKAGELVKAGAIGKVVQTVNLAPHQINNTTEKISRPDWFWDTSRYGGILCDIGSHQADQFIYYTGSTTADVTTAQVANVNHPDKPKFQDFGDMLLYGNRGVGYIRVDWFTPDGLGTWGDGRLFILGTEGYIELRKYVDIAGRKGGNHLFIVDRKQARYLDCSNVVLPFAQQFVSDIVNRTRLAQDQTQALLATELVLKAQKLALPRTFSA